MLARCMSAILSMTDLEAENLASDYNALLKRMHREKNSPAGDRYELEKCEDRMARIETKFQEANRDIMDWI